MTNEEKQLLFKDLCARLPYHPRVKVVPDKGDIYDEWWTFATLPEIGQIQYTLYPYLRPMSSMTEEEREEFRMLILPEASCAYEDCLEWDAQIIGGGYLQISVEDFSKVVDWLNAHHFDYRGLIEKGLALEASEGMYKTR